MFTATMAASILLRISNIIKRFQFQELEDAVLPHFPETSWVRVKTELVKNGKKFSSKNVAQQIEKVITSSKLTVRELQERSALLELIDISRHSKRRIWYGYVMTGPRNSNPSITHVQMQNSIRDHLKSFDIQADIRIETYDSITYVSMKEVKKKKKSASEYFLQAVSVCLGYTNYKRLKLTGKDIRSLDRLHRRKQQGAIDAYHFGDTPIYKDAPPETKNFSVDYTQQKQRQKYAEECFGKDPPNLELVVARAKNEAWADSELLKLQNKTMSMTWEFRSPNVMNFLTKLIERRIVATPLPSYISELMKLGTNELRIKRC